MIVARSAAPGNTFPRLRVEKRRTAPTSVTGTHQLDIALLEAALGAHAYQLWRRFLLVRDDKTGACYASAAYIAQRAAEALGRTPSAEPHGAAWRALAKLVEAGLVWAPTGEARGAHNQDGADPVFGWHTGVNPRDPERRCFVRQVRGYLEWSADGRQVAIVPGPVARWAAAKGAKTERRGGRRPNAGRPSKKTLLGAPCQTDSADPGGAVPSTATGAPPKGVPTEFKRGVQLPVLEFKKGGPSSLTVGKRSLLFHSVKESASRRRADFAQTKGMDLKDLLERGTSEPRRFPLPAWAAAPMERIGRPQATIPAPPSIPRDATEHTAGSLVVEAFELVHRAATGKPFWGWGGKAPSKSPHWPKLVELGQQLAAAGAPPIAWMIWCVRAWRHSRVGMPPIAFVCGTKMLGGSFDMFLQEMPSMWGQAVVGPQQRKLTTTWAKLRNALLTGRYSSPEETYANVVTEAAFGELVDRVRTEIDAAQKQLNKRVEKGEWLWTL